MIVHLDADAFFASVEQAADPKLRGKPVAVGGERRGIIASASYEARELGIYTPMPTARARKLCPRLIIVPGDFEKYEQFSRFMFSYAYDFTPHVEIGSTASRQIDPFAGGGAIPLEAMRLGCRVTASDLNPVAWFVLKCTLDYPQRFAGKKWPLPEFAKEWPDFVEDFVSGKVKKRRGSKRVSFADACRWRSSYGRKHAGRCAPFCRRRSRGCPAQNSTRRGR